MRDVVITGMGATTPVGGDLASTWAALVAGHSGVVRIPDAWAEPLPVQIAGICAVDPSTKIDRVRARRLDRSTQVALVAAEEAWTDAGYRLAGDEEDAARASGLDPERLAVAFGSGIGGLHSTLTNWDAFVDKGARRVSPYTIPMLMSNAPAANIGLMVNAQASVRTTVSACASANDAVALAVDEIRLGRADVVVAGGSEATINPLPLAAFAQMQALSKRNDDPAAASRPWDKGRDGFVLSEGAAVLVLESLEHALARGARIYGTVAGAGISADSHDIVQPDPTGHGQSSAMLKAIADAGLSASDIKHVNAHGTSTPQGDVTEAHSIAKALGAATAGCVVTSTKSMTGHLLGAAGALESVATVLALHHRVVPPTINLVDPEDGLGIDIAANTARDLPAGPLAALNNSFGFGGHNVALAFTNAHVR